MSRSSLIKTSNLALWLRWTIWDLCASLPPCSMKSKSWSSLISCWLRKMILFPSLGSWWSKNWGICRLRLESVKRICTAWIPCRLWRTERLPWCHWCPTLRVTMCKSEEPELTQVIPTFAHTKIRESFMKNYIQKSMTDKKTIESTWQVEWGSWQTPSNPHE